MKHSFPTSLRTISQNQNVGEFTSSACRLILDSTLNCPWFSRKQSAKRMSRKLEGRNSCWKKVRSEANSRNPRTRSSAVQRESRRLLQQQRGPCVVRRKSRMILLHASRMAHLGGARQDSGSVDDQGKALSFGISKMCRIIVVFPALGKPVITVAGVFEIMSPSSTKFAVAVRHSLNPTVPVEGCTLINNRPDRRQASLNPCFMPLAGRTNAALSAPWFEKSKADRYSQCRGIASNIADAQIPTCIFREQTLTCIHLLFHDAPVHIFGDL